MQRRACWLACCLVWSVGDYLRAPSQRDALFARDLPRISQSGCGALVFPSLLNQTTHQPT